MDHAFFIDCGDLQLHQPVVEQDSVASADVVLESGVIACNPVLAPRLSARDNTKARSFLELHRSRLEGARRTFGPERSSGVACLLAEPRNPPNGLDLMREVGGIRVRA